MAVSYEIFFIIAVLLSMTGNLILSYSKNLKLLFKNETNVLESVARGDLSKQVPVATNDEFGVIAGHTNSMIAGLRHRIQLISSLKLAEEIQKNLLPDHPPEIPGLDIAGTSIYCDQTGGDYFDYIMLPDNRLGVVVADASEHGVGAAMLMTTARAFMLYGARVHRDPETFISEINRFLTRDSQKLGRFVTLFYIQLDFAQKTLHWVRAGHEPAILFDPQTRSFQELYGDGMALGIDAAYKAKAYSQRELKPGTVLFIGTDGIHESMNPKGELFGRRRLRDVIAKHHRASAKTIQQKVIERIAEFRGDRQPDDDITLVVIKMVA
jgi:sigma-B regulation protein RsbU (phosphoserine phosphatase)